MNKLFYHSRLAVGLCGCVALLLQAVVAVDTVADDWPQWMGPTRDGVYREAGVIDAIPEDGLPVKWRVPVAAGYSGPAVAGNRVFLTDYVKQSGQSFNDPGKRATLQGQERVHCFDARTGETLWQHAYDRPYSISYPNGPRCTPTVDGDRVYSLGAEGDLLCLNVEDGEVIWQRNFVNDFGITVPIWGLSSHPLVDGELLICLVGGPGQTVVAFDKMTGEVRWKALDASAIGYAPPAIIEAGGKRQLLVWHAEAIVSMNPADGSVYWSVDIKPSYDMAIARPQRDGDLLYASAIHSEAVMLRLDQQQPGVTELWRGERKTAVYCSNSTPMLREGMIFGTDCNVGKLIAVDAQSGERLWETFAATKPDEKRFIKHGTAFLTQLGDSDRYLVLSETGDLIIATLSADGYSEHGRFRVVEPTSEAFGRKVVWSHPAYAGRTAFVRNDEELVAVDIAATP
ncbi:PQQ-binding-like beta-propeller repeat protein [Roseimaritima ulvae]|uniref:Outer membrane biogenesis protein BamB n=1 Tax=Roseimaritima ulvae TaxID=980254 RepID=A0A5B9QWT3_9BACT|nr:PQQ-binding-like beta-propeller repeat protein [Roseimaritima ulvae]QEG42452.1 outer membrane biogenesis protein BamB [Roseimaritima ulvae]